MKRENRLRRNNVILIIMPKTHPGFAVKKYSNFVVMMMMMIIIIKYSLLSQSQGLLVCSNRNRKSGGHQQGRDGLFVRTWKARHTMHRWPPWERLPLPATLHVNATLQCGRCFGYLHPHNPRGLNVAVPTFVLVFSLVFSPRDIYYRGQLKQ